MAQGGWVAWQFLWNRPGLQYNINYRLDTHTLTHTRILFIYIYFIIKMYSLYNSFHYYKLISFHCPCSHLHLHFHFHFHFQCPCNHVLGPFAPIPGVALLGAKFPCQLQLPVEVLNGFGLELSHVLIHYKNIGINCLGLIMKIYFY